MPLWPLVEADLVRTKMYHSSAGSQRGTKQELAVAATAATVLVAAAIAISFLDRPHSAAC